MCATYRKSIVSGMQAAQEEVDNNPFGAPADQALDEQPNSARGPRSARGPKSARGEQKSNFEQLK